MTPPVDCRPMIVGRAADILDATIANISAAHGELDQQEWGSLLAVQGLLRGDHGFTDGNVQGCGFPPWATECPQ